MTQRMSVLIPASRDTWDDRAFVDGLRQRVIDARHGVGQCVKQEFIEGTSWTADGEAVQTSVIRFTFELGEYHVPGLTYGPNGSVYSSPEMLGESESAPSTKAEGASR